MHREWYVSVVLLFAVVGYCQSTATSNGRVEGTVVNEEGQVVQHATVCTSLTRGSSTTIKCQAASDKDGRFQIGDLEFGTYRMFAIKEDEGYSITDQGAAISASTRPGPLRDFYVARVETGMRPTMARLTLARKIAAITLAMWKKGVGFNPQNLPRQAA